jgi:hypothetical protein
LDTDFIIANDFVENEFEDRLRITNVYFFGFVVHVLLDRFTARYARSRLRP